MTDMVEQLKKLRRKLAIAFPGSELFAAHNCQKAYVKQLRAQLADAVAEREVLVAQLGKAIADEERLDWLDNYKSSICCVTWEVGMTLRQAIDKARKDKDA